MVTKNVLSECKWLLFALIIGYLLYLSFNNGFTNNLNSLMMPQTILGLNLFLEILVFFVFSTFVVFGIRGFFEMYSQKVTNIIMFISGIFLILVIFIMSYQLLML